MTNPPRILIVGDSADDTEVTLLELSRGGLTPDWKRVETADEMRAALAEGPWDAVLSDFSLPGSSAAEALALCRTTDPDLPFIVVSGIIGEERAVDMMRAGAGDYLLKGNLTRLSAAVEREIREAGSRRARRRAEAAALLQAALVQSSTDAIIAKTVDGVITNWNPAAVLLFGWTPEEVVGRHISFIVPATPTNMPRSRIDLQTASESRRSRRFDSARTVRGWRCPSPPLALKQAKPRRIF